MSDNKELYWLAPGVIAIDGKEYGAETPLPVGKIDAEKLKKWEKAGKVGCKIAPVNVSQSGEIDRLKDENKTLKLDNEEKAALIDKLKAKLDRMKGEKK